jgi:phosphoglycolate phosphatase-like HAD superfamily hydrolase
LNHGRAWILDLDGTMMPSSEIDNVCFWRAVHEVFESPPRILDLASFPEVTDSALLLAWCRETLGRAPREAEVSAVRARFFALLESAARERPECFTPTPGLVDWLARHRAEGAALAVATGGWAPSARLKLRWAGLARFELPLASSDDCERRTDIMRRALERILPKGPGCDTAPVYVGDGPWDLDAARALGWEFIGIARDAAAERLLERGARRVLADFLGFDTVAESRRASPEGLS